MPLTPQQLADFQRLRQSYAPVVEAQRRKQQAQANLEKMHGLPPVKPQPKADGGSADANLAQFLEGSHTPMRLYHSTTQSEGGKGQEALSKLKMSKEGSLGAGVYMTPSAAHSSGYSGSPNQEALDLLKSHPSSEPIAREFENIRRTGNLKPGQIGGYMMPLKAKVKNPLKITGEISKDPMVEALIRLGVDRMKAEKMVEKAYEKKGYIGKEVMTRALAKGHDALMQYRNGNLSEVVHYNPKMIKSAIGNRGTYDTTKDDLNMAKGGKIEVRPTVFDDAASRRNPKIEEAARALLAGNIKQKDYEKLVAKEKPVKPYSFIPKPATDEQAMKVLIDRQKQNWRSHESWPAGHPVGLRLDIPAYERHGVWVNSVHDESGQKPAFPTSYGPVSSVRNAEFHGSPHKAARVATGEQSKTPFARIMGNIEHMDEEQAVKHFQKYMNHPDYRQIGYDPRRHGDFYDRETMQPVTHSEHVVQIGPLVLAKKPVYGKRTVYAKGGVAHMAVGGADWKPHPENDLLQPIGSSKMVGDEKLVADDGAFKSGLSMFPSSKKSYRYVYHGEDQTPIGAMQIATQGPRSKKAVIQNLYVAEANRRQGIASKLLDRARKDFDVKHSTDLTSAGRAFAKAKKARGGRVTHAHHLEIEERPL